VSIPGTPYEEGSVNGAACIKAVATDRVQLISCTGFSDRSVVILFSSISFIENDASHNYVTIYLRRD
jgi:hypothetical protein